MKLETTLKDCQAAITSVSSPSHTALQLTTLRVAAMTEAELLEALPKLVSAIHREGLAPRQQPEWWPTSVPWAAHNLCQVSKDNSIGTLRRVVQFCLSHLSAQQSVEEVRSKPRILDWLNSNPLSRSCTQNPKKPVARNRRGHGYNAPFLEIYLCYLCGEEFSCKEVLQKHQVRCTDATLTLSIPTTPPASEAPSPESHTSISDHIHINEDIPTLVIHQPSFSSVLFRDFVAGLDLVPVSRAKKIRQARRRNTECETLDLEEPQTPISPSTPRTPKLLISQLSREPSNSGNGDSNSGRRRLSYLRQTSEKKGDKEGEENGSDSEGSTSSAEDAEDCKLGRKTLLSIDVTSILGQRVLRHMTSEALVPVIKDAEQFCRTPIKTKYQDRLRARQQIYPITYKLTRKHLHQHHYCHLYKFTLADRIEFMEKMRTGLNKQCRGLLKCLLKCHVIVERLSLKTILQWKPSMNKVSVMVKPLTLGEILHWTKPKQSSRADVVTSVFPEGPTILLSNIDRVLGLKRKAIQSQNHCKLSASQCLSEVANAELQQQKLTVYRSLLTDLSRCTVAKENTAPTYPAPTFQAFPSSTPVKNVKKESSHSDKKYPTIFSILSNTAPKRRKDKVSGVSCSADFKTTLEIDIPSAGRESMLFNGSGNGNSPVEDNFSIKTTSSDEAPNQRVACCTLCTNSFPESGHSLGQVSCTATHSHISSSNVTDSPHLSPCFSQQELSPISTSRKDAHLQVSPSKSRVIPLLQKLSHQSSKLSSPSAKVSSVRKVAVANEVPQQSVKSEPQTYASDLTLNVSLFNKSLNHQRDLKNLTLTEGGIKSGNSSVRKTKKRSFEVVSSNLEKQGSDKKNSNNWFSGNTRRSASPCYITESNDRKKDAASQSLKNHLIALDIHDQWQEQTSVQSALVSRKLRSGNIDISEHKDFASSSQGDKDKSSHSSAMHNVQDLKMAILSHAKDGDLSPRSMTRSQALGHKQTSKSGFNSKSNHVSKNESTPVIQDIDRVSLSEPPLKSLLQSVPSVPLFGGEQSKPRTDSSGSSAMRQTVNPFLLTKAEAALFSSRIRAQARRKLDNSQQSITSNGEKKGVLRSGNSFRVQNSLLETQSSSDLRTRTSAWSCIFKTQGSFSKGANSHTSTDQKNTFVTELPKTSYMSPEHQIPSPQRKRLSPLQMLSVLQSAKGIASVVSVRKSSARCDRKESAHSQKRNGQEVSLGKRHLTRSTEIVSPAKKSRV